ncbi:hypothetical protein [Flavobacterium sp. SLB02]|nr:hypothetical protein [Flavobacterium sp. SLB02]QGK73070.1 hypothetical protein GIY83_03000 [Flavobacterium sp. SLB02]
MTIVGGVSWGDFCFIEMTRLCLILVEHSSIEIDKTIVIDDDRDFNQVFH